MNGYRKRRSSDSVEGDRKRISYERYDCDSFIKQECNTHVSNNGRLNCVAVPYNYCTPAAPPVCIRSAIVYNPNRYCNSQYVEPYMTSDNGNVISRNYNTGHDDAISMYDNSRQSNFKHEVYINSLRQSEPRHVDYNDLRRHLFNIDIRYLRNRNFSTALDLTQELESSLKYFVDTRNELVFLGKLQRSQCVPFSYNDIHIANRSGLQNRISFLENESSYRSHRMNQLFHQLQCVVIPSIIDDIRHVHSVSYERSWANRARYWFSLLKEIRLKKSVRTTNRPHHRYQQSKHHHRSHRSHGIKDELDVANNNNNNVNIKSEVVSMPKIEKTVKIEKLSIIQPKHTTANKPNPNDVQPVERIQTMSNIVEKTVETVDCNNNSMKDKNVGAEPQVISVVANDKVDAAADEENENELSKSLVVIEPNVSVVNVADDENDVASTSNAIPPEGDTEN